MPRIVPRSSECRLPHAACLDPRAIVQMECCRAMSISSRAKYMRSTGVLPDTRIGEVVIVSSRY